MAIAAELQYNCKGHVRGRQQAGLALYDNEVSATIVFFKKGMAPLYGTARKVLFSLVGSVPLHHMTQVL